MQVGLRNLDGYERVIKDADREKTAFVRYNLTAAMRRLISKNLKAIATALEDYQDKRTALMLSLITDGSDTVPDNKKGQFAIEDARLQKETVDIDLKTFTEADLKLDDNPIAGSGLELLEPLVSE
jgi:hypothetical protein